MLDSVNTLQSERGKEREGGKERADPSGTSWSTQTVHTLAFSQISGHSAGVCPGRYAAIRLWFWVSEQLCWINGGLTRSWSEAGSCYQVLESFWERFPGPGGWVSTFLQHLTPLYDSPELCQEATMCLVVVWKSDIFPALELLAVKPSRLEFEAWLWCYFGFVSERGGLPVQKAASCLGCQELLN